MEEFCTGNLGLGACLSFFGDREERERERERERELHLGGFLERPQAPLIGVAPVTERIMGQP